MQVGSVHQHPSLTQALAKQEISASVLAKTQQAAKAQGDAATAAIQGASEEQNEAPDQDDGGSRLSVIA